MTIDTLMQHRDGWLARWRAKEIWLVACQSKSNLLLWYMGVQKNLLWQNELLDPSGHSRDGGPGHSGPLCTVRGDVCTGGLSFDLHRVSQIDGSRLIRSPIPMR